MFTVCDDYSQSVPMVKNTRILMDNNVVGGVVEFSTTENYKEKTISEYLSSQPYSVVASEKEYKVTLKMLGNNNDYSEVSSLTIGNIMYMNCNVLSDNIYTQSGDVYRTLIMGFGERRFLNNG